MSSIRVCCSQQGLNGKAPKKGVGELLSLVLAISIVFPTEMYAQLGCKGNVKVENVRFKPQGYVTEILYDLVGSADTKYHITVTFRSRSNELLNRNIIVADGDIGAGVSPGRDKKVMWGLIGEFPQGLPDNDYFFVVTAERAAPQSSLVLWVAAGMFALCVVIFVILLRDRPQSESVGVGPPSRSVRSTLSPVH